MSRPTDAAAGPAAALAVLAALDARHRSACRLSSSSPGPKSMRAFVRAQRKAGTKATDVAVVELREGKAGFLRSDGALLPQRLHPRLVALMRGAAPAGAAGRARRHRSRAPRAGRRSRWRAARTSSSS